VEVLASIEVEETRVLQLYIQLFGLFPPHADPKNDLHCWRVGVASRLLIDMCRLAGLA